MRNKVDCLCEIGVLRKVNRSKQAAPTYLVKKKNVNAEGIAKAGFISDFRQLNVCIKRTLYPIPKIQDMLQQLEGFTTFESAIDLNMGYYHIKLDAESCKLCTIVLPWGKYEYTSLVPTKGCISPISPKDAITPLQFNLAFHFSSV